MRRGHVTATVASRFAALASMMLRCSTDSVVLRQLMDTAPHGLAEEWHESFHGNHEPLAGSSTEQPLFSWVGKSEFVLSLFTAGLAESRHYHWMAASPNSIGNVDVARLVIHLQREFPTAVEAISGEACCHLPFQYTTFDKASASRYQAIVDKRGTTKSWMACSMASGDFTRIVPDIACRRQLIHAAATFDVPAVVFVAATERSGNPIISKTLVVTDVNVIKHHVDTLRAFADELLGWMFRGPTAHAPDWMDNEVITQLESRQQVWWSTRMVVLREGPLHPVETMQSALVEILNGYVHLGVTSTLCSSRAVGVIDSPLEGVDSLQWLLESEYYKRTVASTSFQQPLMCSLLLLCVGNCVAHYRLAVTRGDLDEEAWPSLPVYMRHLRDFVPSQDIVLRIAMELLEAGGSTPDAHLTAPSPTSAPREANAGLSDAVMDGLADTLRHIHHSVKRRQWFMSAEGQAFRSHLSPRHTHTVVPEAKRSFCVVCSVTVAGSENDTQSDRERKKNKRRRKGRLSRYRCATCQVYVCIVAREGSPVPCSRRWHSSEVL